MSEEQVEQEGSDLVKDLRAQLKAKNSEIKALSDQIEQAKQEARTETLKEVKIEDALSTVNPPEKLRNTVANELKELSLDDLTDEAVAQVFSEYGLDRTRTEAPEPTTEQIDSLANVTSLSGSLSGDFSGSEDAQLQRRIDSAKSPEEVDKIMTEAGYGGFG